MEKSGTRIAVFKNDSNNDKAPALKGFIEVDGKKVKDVALWQNKNGNGYNGTISEPYKSEAVAQKEVAPATVPDAKGDLPF